MRQRDSARIGLRLTLVACLLSPAGAGCRRNEPAPSPAATAVAPAGTEGLERVLGKMEEALRACPPGHTMPSTYRKWCVKNDRHDRPIEFLRELVEAHPDDTRLRIEYANSFIDKIPTCTGITAVISRGNLARKSLDQLDAVLAKYPDMWPALYCRGMNHLHWPKALRHSDDAVADFERCLDLQKQNGRGNERPYYSRTHVALGDAHTKAERYDQARDVWRRALELFPEAEELHARLAIDDDAELLEYVRSQRSLERGIDTDMSFLDDVPEREKGGRAGAANP